VLVRVLILLIGAGVALGCSQEATRGPDAASRPSLIVVRKAPLSVRGSDFRPGEAIRVTAGRRTVRTKANENGYFIVTIRGASRCDVARVLARGSAGSYAVVKLLPSPECLPARSD
jgi:hypothetical protein